MLESHRTGFWLTCQLLYSLYSRMISCHCAVARWTPEEFGRVYLTLITRFEGFSCSNKRTPIETASVFVIFSDGTSVPRETPLFAGHIAAIESSRVLRPDQPDRSSASLAPTCQRLRGAQLRNFVVDTLHSAVWCTFGWSRLVVIGQNMTKHHSWWDIIWLNYIS